VAGGNGLPSKKRSINPGICYRIFSIYYSTGIKFNKMIFQRGDFSSNSLSKGAVNESLAKVRTFSASSESTAKPTIFLAHKHDDLDDLQGVMGQLEQLGAKIYIDSMDNKMPQETSGVTAARIKKVIKFCNKFILLATGKAIQSYWCNWELGIGDTHKFIEHIAILPMKEKGAADSSWPGNEYLQIYPSIQYEDGTSHYSNGNPIAKGYYVVKPPDVDGVRRYTSFNTWLSKR
jgi:hypothetical protein